MCCSKVKWLELKVVEKAEDKDGDDGESGIS